MQSAASSQTNRSDSATGVTGTNTSSNAVRRIIIIGGGVAGLTLALALKRASQRSGLAVQCVIYEATQTYTERGPHYLLWAWAVQALQQLGLARRLGRVSWPVASFSSVAAASGESLVQWPDATASSSAPAPAPAPVSSSSNSSAAATAAADPEALAGSYLPPLVGMRKADLLRLLMTALAGRDDLVADTELAFKPANNSDLALFAPGAGSSASATPSGIEADLAVGNWFLDEEFNTLLPELILGHELSSYVISSSTGNVSVRFTNGVTDHGFMLIGADGAHSK
eukprot:jgi/Hompol1/3843/HPOL_006781-RA